MFVIDESDMLCENCKLRVVVGYGLMEVFLLIGFIVMEIKDVEVGCVVLCC